MDTGISSRSAMGAFTCGARHGRTDRGHLQSVPGGALSGRHGDHGVSVCLKQPVVLPERHRTGIQHGAPGGQGDPEATD